MIDNVFQLLVFGLQQHIEEGGKYPLPTPLTFALSQLGFTMQKDFPKTRRGALTLMHSPLNEWWPLELPTFDGRASLLYEGELSSQALEYLEDLIWYSRVPGNASTAQIQFALDNIKLRDLILRLRGLYAENPQVIQNEYEQFRRFLIENAWTTRRKIILCFERMQYITERDVGEFYLPLDKVADQYAYTGENGRSLYKTCALCGPLLVKHKRWCSIKPSLCAAHCPGDDHWSELQTSRETRVLRKAHHLRTVIPGIPELNFFDHLQNLQGNYSQIVRVALWPHIDEVDFLIEFIDETWAIDMKDYTDPYRLKGLCQSADFTKPRYADRLIITFPSYRLNQRGSYRSVVDELQQTLSASISLLDSEQLLMEIQQKARGG